MWIKNKVYMDKKEDMVLLIVGLCIVVVGMAAMLIIA